MMYIFGIFAFLAAVGAVAGHGRLVEPPSRSSMWRYGFHTPPNYNDHELFCGGIGVQWSTNGGRCGVCGDPYNAPQPRNNEAGGKYGRGVIVRRFKPGQIIKASVELTANHLGHFEFKICPNNNPKKIVSQDCLDQYPVYLADGSPKLKIQPYYVGFVNTTLKLPDGLTCTQCVLQWQYSGGNNWGRCADGHGGLGCGPQETFRACADIAIGDENTLISTPSTATEKGKTKTTTKRPTRTRQPRTTKTNKKTTTTTTPATPNNNGGNKKNCRAAPRTILPGMNFWCKTNCAMGNCPSNLCVC